MQEKYANMPIYEMVHLKKTGFIKQNAMILQMNFMLGIFQTIRLYHLISTSIQADDFVY